MSLYQDWNVFGCLVETAVHGGRTGGRVAFNGHRTAFDDQGCPITLTKMGPVLKRMGCCDDEIVEDCDGIASEFYGTRVGSGAVRGALPQLSARECVSWADAEEALLTDLGLTNPAACLRRFMKSGLARHLDADDREFIWAIIRECGRCENEEQVSQLESLIETIERTLPRLRAKAAQAEAESAQAEAESAPRPVTLTPRSASSKDVGRKGNKRGRRGGRRRDKGKAPQAKPAAKAEPKPEAKKDRKPFRGREHRIAFTLVNGEWEHDTGRGVILVLRRNSKLNPGEGEEGELYHVRECSRRPFTRRGHKKYYLVDKA